MNILTIRARRCQTTISLLIPARAVSDLTRAFSSEAWARRPVPPNGASLVEHAGYAVLDRACHA
jgi:hypothetical protein